MVAKNDKPENDELVIKRDPELVKREEAELARKRTAELAERNIQPLRPGFTIEEIAWLVVFVLMLIVPAFIPQTTVDDHQLSILLFIVLPFLAWFIRLIYLDAKRNGR
jgi:hypothetical protein